MRKLSQQISEDMMSMTAQRVTGLLSLDVYFELGRMARYILEGKAGQVKDLALSQTVSETAHQPGKKP